MPIKQRLHYFSYGSNMSFYRLRSRVRSAMPLGCHSLKKHDLRFHKSSKDKSGKCDAYFTDNENDIVYGVLFKIDKEEKSILDKAEGLGFGYDEKEVTVLDSTSKSIIATTYIATNIEASLKPYTWYLNHVLIGANESSLPTEYIETKIKTIEAIDDPSKKRDAKERGIHERQES